MRATSNRKLAEALGVSETAVRKALATGRISRDADGGFDIPRVKRQWAGNTDAAQQRPAAKAGLRPVPAAALASGREGVANLSRTSLRSPARRSVYRVPARATRPARRRGALRLEV